MYKKILCYAQNDIDRVKMPHGFLKGSYEDRDTCRRKKYLQNFYVWITVIL